MWYPLCERVHMQKHKYTITALGILLVISTIIYVYVHKKSQENRVLGIMRVARINKDQLIFPKDSEFKYYSELQSLTEATDQRLWDGTIAKYHFNQDGLHDRFDYSTIKKDDSFRILTLGDSFTFGHYVDTLNNWTEILEDRLNNAQICSYKTLFEVINLGMRGFDVPYIVKRYNDKGLKYHPDLIIWFESGSGFNRNNELMQPIIRSCEEKLSTDSGSIADMIANECWHDVEQEITKLYSSEKLKDDHQKWITYFHGIRETIPVIFAGFENTDIKGTYLEKYKNQQNQFILNNITDIASNKGTLPDGHPNEIGHKMIAEDIFEFLQNNANNLQICNTNN